MFNQEPTGYFGTVTEQAVRAFQRQQEIKIDGIANKLTRQLLNERTSLSPTTGEFNVMNLVADASEQLGVPYLWGGTTAEGFDCSGFIQHVFSKSGIQLPRTVAQMWEIGKGVDEPKIGDLVFFETYTAGPSHAGIYIGNDQFVHSGATSGVSIGSMQAKYWKDRYMGTKRMY